MQTEQNLIDVALDQSEEEPKTDYLELLNKYSSDEFAIKRAYQILRTEELTEEEQEGIINFIMERGKPKCIECGSVIQDADVMAINGEAYCPECFGKFWERIRRK